MVEADPEAAAERELAAAQEQFAKVGRSNDHGQKTLYVKDHAAAITRIDATIAYLADGLVLWATPIPRTLVARRRCC